MKTKLIALFLITFIFSSNAQLSRKLQLKDFEIKTNNVTAIKETSVSYFDSFTPENYVNYTFNNDGFVTSDRHYTKISYQNSYSKLSETAKNDNTTETYTIINTPIASYLSETNQVTKNQDGSIKNIFFKNQEEKKNVNISFKYEPNEIITKPDVSYLFTNIYTREGLLVRELNENMGNYYNAYDSKTKLISVKLFNILKETNDTYYLYTYEFDSFGNWIVKYEFQSYPSFGSKLDQLVGIEVREIQYKNGTKTGYNTINQQIKNQGLDKVKKLNVTVLNKDSFPVFFDYKEKTTSNNTNSLKADSNCQGDCQNGWGKYTYDNGSYTGYWANGKKNGFGFYEWNDNASYYGNWENNDMVGFSQYTYPNGNQFLGNFVKSKFHGSGVIIIKETGKSQIQYYENGNMIKEIDYKYNNVSKGCVNGDCKNGFGKYIFDNEIIFVGDFSNYKLLKGMMVFTNGDVYMGNFNTQSQFQGYGFYSYSESKDFYYGDWKNNKKEGKAYAVSNDKFEIGEYVNGKFVNKLGE